MASVTNSIFSNIKAEGTASTGGASGGGGGGVSTNNYVDAASFSTADGILTLSRLGLSDVTVDLDGRYADLTGATFTGAITATSIIMTGGTSSQFLKADGTIDSSTYLTTADLSGYLLNTTDTFTGTLDVVGTLDVTGTITSSGILSVDSTTQSTSVTTGSIHTDGGLGIVKQLYVGGNAYISGTTNLSSDLNISGVNSDITVNDGSVFLKTTSNGNRGLLRVYSEEGTERFQLSANATRAALYGVNDVWIYAGATKVVEISSGAFDVTGTGAFTGLVSGIAATSASNFVIKSQLDASPQGTVTSVIGSTNITISGDATTVPTVNLSTSLTGMVAGTFSGTVQGSSFNATTDYKLNGTAFLDSTGLDITGTGAFSSKVTGVTGTSGNEFVTFDGVSSGFVTLNSTQDITGIKTFTAGTRFENTESIPIQFRRTSSIAEMMTISIDDANAVFEMTQDETSGGYGGFKFVLDSGDPQAGFQVRHGATLLSVINSLIYSVSVPLDVTGTGAFTGLVSGIAATSANNFVIKSQLDAVSGTVTSVVGSTNITISGDATTIPTVNLDTSLIGMVAGTFSGTVQADSFNATTDYKLNGTTFLNSTGLNVTGTAIVTASNNSDWASTITNNGTTSAHGLYVNIGASSTGTPFRVDKGGSELFSVSNSGVGLFASTLSASNLSGTNTGDQDLSGYALLSGAAFTGAISTTSTITTGAPSSGTAADWKLGSIVTGETGLAIDTTKYLELQVGSYVVQVAVISAVIP